MIIRNELFAVRKHFVTYRFELLQSVLHFPDNLPRITITLRKFIILRDTSVGYSLKIQDSSASWTANCWIEYNRQWVDKQLFQKFWQGFSFKRWLSKVKNDYFPSFSFTIWLLRLKPVGFSPNLLALGIKTTVVYSPHNLSLSLRSSYHTKTHFLSHACVWEALWPLASFDHALSRKHRGLPAWMFPWYPPVKPTYSRYRETHSHASVTHFVSLVSCYCKAYLLKTVASLVIKKSCPTHIKNKPKPLNYCVGSSFYWKTMPNLSV